MNIEKKRIIACADGIFSERDDDLVIESPLEIKVNGRPIYYCMRMPGMDKELAAGLCYNDGRLLKESDLIGAAQPDNNVVEIEMNESAVPGSEEMKIIRSSSGVIRKGQDLLSASAGGGDADNFTFTAEIIFNLQNDFFTRQEVFERTGATHAAALYGRGGEFLIFAEDVGRHNALDKCVGRLLLQKSIDKAYFCILSSRLSYEMVMKGSRSGALVIAGVSAPTSLAVDLAREKGVTLVGFLRKNRFNIYSGEQRVQRG